MTQTPINSRDITDKVLEMKNIFRKKKESINNKLSNQLEDCITKIDYLEQIISNESKFIEKNNNLIKQLAFTNKTNTNTTTNTNEVFVFPTYNKNYNTFEKKFITLVNNFQNSREKSKNKAYNQKASYTKYSKKYLCEVDALNSLKKQYKKYNLNKLISHQRESKLLTKRVLKFKNQIKHFLEEDTSLRKELVVLRSEQLQIYIKHHINPVFIKDYVNNNGLLSNLNNKFFFDTHAIDEMIKNIAGLDKKIKLLQLELSVFQTNLKTKIAEQTTDNINNQKQTELGVFPYIQREIHNKNFVCDRTPYLIKNNTCFTEFIKQLSLCYQKKIIKQNSVSLRTSNSCKCIRNLSVAKKRITEDYLSNRRCHLEMERLTNHYQSRIRRLEKKIRV